MLLYLLAIISSTALLVSAISAEQHFTWHSLFAVALALTLAAANFFGVLRAGWGLATITSEKSEAVEAWYGIAFSLVALVWAICAGFIGFWLVRFVNNFL